MAKRIGVLTNNQSLVFQSGVIDGILEVAEAEKYEVLIDSRAHADNPNQDTDLNVNILAGLIVVANVASDAFLSEIYRDGIPISLISHTVSDVPIPAVIPNNEQGIAKLVEHLVIDCNRKKFVFINGDMNQNDGIEREQSFLREMIRHNIDIDPSHLLQGDFIGETAADSMQAFLQTKHEFDAVIAADYLMAVRATEVLQSAGLNVPEDIAVAGFGDGPESRDIELTTVGADISQLGRRSMRQLIGQMNGMHIRGTTLLSVDLEIRETCGYNLVNA